ncbi:hypothetical protein D7Y13_16120 [Corallococcus praedator]|uniref:Peptidase M4 domain-containing protein n=1 Tax=Corallococcus praedator TaxID=2316724 RepID=A0ABX9QK39_9BACT|nr:MULTISPECIES: Ig-like domain-containing protein [Corallococcus]RKH28725.1 hypothetical protein D7X75_24170 [Corallococcus sp. CA031C]RKI08371.1 hypothetical protein D7Y13_16120 [Corallococcus praedator]
MRFRRWLPFSLIVVLSSCNPAEVEPESPEGEKLQAQAEQLASERGFSLQEVTLVPALEGAGNRHTLHLKGVPVWGLEAKTVNGRTLFTNARFEPTSPVDTESRITQAQAEVAVLEAMKDASARVEDLRLVLLPQVEHRQRKDALLPASGRANAVHFERVVTGMRLIYRLRLSTGTSPGWARSWSAQVDAHSGQVLRLEPLEVNALGTPQALPPLGTFRNATGYGRYAGTFTFSTRYDTDEELYLLQDERTNTYMAYSKPSESGTTVIEPYESDDASFGDGQIFNTNNDMLSANGETAAVDALHAVNLAWSVYETFLSRSGPTGLGYGMNIRVHQPSNNATYSPHPTRPTVMIGYAGLMFPPGNPRSPLATADIVGHELGHDFFMREVAGNPVNFPAELSELQGMNEGTGDIFGFITELGRDTVRARRPLSGIDTTTLKPSNLTLGEDSGLIVRNILSPQYPEWFKYIGQEPVHRAGGPLGRMFLLLAYGCTPMPTSGGPGPWNCSLVPEGFTGLGPAEALRVWGLAVQSLPMGADYVQARHSALAAAHTRDVTYGGPRMRAVAYAFAAINVGFAPDVTPPQTTLSCLQVDRDIECSGTITDAEIPNQYNTPPQLVVDGGALTVTLSGWDFTELLSGATLASGTHTLQLKAWDYWNNLTTRTVSVVLDKTGPTASVTRSGPPKEPRLSVTASDASGVLMVEFKKGAQDIVPTVFSPPYDALFNTSTWTDGTHDITVNVFDVYGNVTVLHHALKVDNTRPAVAMTVSGSAPPFSVNATVSDASEVTRVDFKMDMLVFATRTNNASSYQAQYSPSDALSHNLHMEVTDAFGNKGVAMVAAPRDQTPPQVTASKTQVGSIVRLQVSTSDTCDIQYPYSLYVDANLVAQPTTPSYLLEFGASMAGGPHMFQALVRDRCGNLTNFQTVFVKDVTPPVITSILRDDSQPKKPKFTVQCTDDEAVHHVEMRENGVVKQIDTLAPYEFVVDTTGRQDGNYTVLFHCADTGGLASTPETRTVVADNTGPAFIASMFGGARSYLINAENVSDPRGISSVWMSTLFGLSFSVMLTQPPYSVQWTIPPNINITSGALISFLAIDSWGNETLRAFQCPVNTNSTVNTYALCTPVPAWAPPPVETAFPGP